MSNRALIANALRPREDFCPRCRKRGAIHYHEDGRREYACGSIYNPARGTFDEIDCEFRKITPSEALDECSMLRGFFLLPQDTFKESYHRDADMRLSREKLSMRHGVKYLLWDSDVLLGVWHNVEGLIGSQVGYGGPMNIIYIADPALMRGAFDMVMGTWIHADETGLFMADIMLDIRSEVGDLRIKWWLPVKWDEPITSEQQAVAVATYTWLQQPYVQLPEAIHYSAKAQKFAKRKGKTLNNISVLEFRRPKREGSEAEIEHSDEEAKRAYSVCFMRTGFCRKQWYPGEKVHKPKWIAPTLVGDPEKLPFKPKGQTLYRARR